MFVGILAQNKNKQKDLKSVHVDKKQPTIYLTFERIRNIERNAYEEDNERIWLRLHNNTYWGIRLEASGENKVFGNTKLYYDILNSDEKFEERIRCHVCSIITLGEGKSILFSFPRKHFTEGNFLRLKFSYEWENSDDVFAGRSPTHYVYFYSINLPKYVVIP